MKLSSDPGSETSAKWLTIASCDHVTVQRLKPPEGIKSHTYFCGDWDKRTNESNIRNHDHPFFHLDHRLEQDERLRGSDLKPQKDNSNEKYSLIVKGI